MHKSYIIILITVFSFNSLLAQDSTKKSMAYGILPAIAYSSDLGFQYGVLTNIYWHGKPSIYPEYHHSLYMEASKFTAGSSLLRMYYDTHKLLSPIRTTVDLTYISDQMMDFYGFNGYQTVYYQPWEDDENKDGNYITRGFYKHHRDLFRIMVNLKGPLLSSVDHLQWIGGITFFDMNIHTIDVDKINKKADPKLPINTKLLYDNYVDWGIISKEEKNGGKNAYLKLGLSYDTRNFESNPSKGIFSEVFMTSTPSFFSSHSKTYTRFTATHRQYLTLIKNKSIFAYRLMLQNTIQGEVPFYLLPHITSSTLRSATNQGLGGATTMRGIKRNRIVGDGIFLANLELRQMLVRFNAFKQDIYIATNLFSDMGVVFDPYDVDRSSIPNTINQSEFFSNENDKLHTSLGLGLKIALNENFIVSVDYGRALDKQDGDSGIYIVLNYLF